MADVAGNMTTGSTIAIGATIEGQLETISDHDWYKLELTAGDQVAITLTGVSLADPYLRIRDSAGNVVYENDNIRPELIFDSRVIFTAASTGTYFVDVGASDDNGSGSYQIKVEPYTPLPVWSIDQIADFLVSGYHEGNGASAHQFDATEGGTITVNVTALNTAGKYLAREALALWSDIIGVAFVEVTSGGQITFDDNQTGAFAQVYQFGGSITQSHVNIQASRLITFGSTIGSYSFQNYIHEIGHALGLGHAGFYGGGPTDPYTDALYANDARSTTAMSYFPQDVSTYFADLGFSYAFLVTPMIADVAAMGLLYGLSTTTRTGNTTYGFNSNAGRDSFDATVHPNVAYTIFDSGGVDTLDYSGFGANQVIRLTAGDFSSVGGLTGNVVIALGTVIENAIGGSGNDQLFGNSAGNVLNGGTGADFMAGGAGNDAFYVDNAGDQASEALNEGTDHVYSSVNYYVWANVENLTLTGTATNGGGNAGNNIIIGNAQNNVLNGDVGADTMLGGAGNDIFYVDNAGDQVSEIVNEGTDHVYSSMSFSLWSNVENLTLTGTATNGGGNAANNIIIGNAQNNVLNGDVGADTMLGGAGNDIFYVDNAGDAASEIADQGTDHVYSSMSFSLWSNVENLTLTGSATNGGGNDLDNIIIGNAQNNVLNGDVGADTMLGGAGNDIFYVDNAGDQVSEIVNEGTDHVYSSMSFSLWSNVENLTLTGTAITGGGNAANNIIIGNAMNNVLNGDVGADTMLGGAGNDIFYVDNAGDQVSEIAGEGSDQVYSSVSFTLWSNVENLTLTGASATNATGNAGGNSLAGNSAANVLAGGGGNDILLGGAGADSFLFDTSPNAATNVDQIIDFSVTDDTILLDDDIFAGLSLGMLDASAFRTGAAATDADDRIIYDSATGNLYYDADGNGAAAATLFAQVSAGTALTNSDFLIVG